MFYSTQSKRYSQAEAEKEAGQILAIADCILTLDPERDPADLQTMRDQLLGYLLGHITLEALDWPDARWYGIVRAYLMDEDESLAVAFYSLHGRLIECEQAYARNISLLENQYTGDDYNDPVLQGTRESLAFNLHVNRREHLLDLLNLESKASLLVAMLPNADFASAPKRKWEGIAAPSLGHNWRDGIVDRLVANGYQEAAEIVQNDPVRQLVPEATV